MSTPNKERYFQVKSKAAQCKICQHHEFFIIVEKGDFLYLTTTFGFPSAGGRYIHEWHKDDTIVPPCLNALKEVNVR